MNNTLKLNRYRDDYYEAAAAQITALGYNNPATDTDLRQRNIWEYIKQNSLSVRIISNFDYRSNMANRSSSRYAKIQTRGDNEDPTKVQGLKNQFYDENGKANERQKRIPFGWIFEDDKKYYASVGNKRGQAHILAQEQHNLTASIGSVGIIGGDLSDSDREWHAFHIAELSNVDDGEAPEEEKPNDIVGQLKALREMSEERGLVSADETEEQKVEWGKAWVLKTKPTYRGEEMSKVVGDIANRAFVSDRSDSIPMPKNSEISDVWEGHFPDEPFDPSNTDADVTMIVISGCDKQVIFRSMTDKWSNGATPTDKREEYWCVVRCGNGARDVTSLRSLLKRRLNGRQQFAWFNNNERYASAGMPRCTRLMFVKQLKGGGDDYEVFRWNSIKKEFTPVKRQK